MYLSFPTSTILYYYWYVVGIDYDCCVITEEKVSEVALLMIVCMYVCIVITYYIAE